MKGRVILVGQGMQSKNIEFAGQLALRLSVMKSLIIILWLEHTKDSNLMKNDLQRPRKKKAFSQKLKFRRRIILVHPKN